MDVDLELWRREGAWDQRRSGATRMSSLRPRTYHKLVLFRVVGDFRDGNGPGYVIVLGGGPYVKPKSSVHCPHGDRWLHHYEMPNQKVVVRAEDQKCNCILRSTHLSIPELT